MSRIQLQPRDRTIDPDVLARPVGGHGVPEGSTLGALLQGRQATLLVFLRHYG